MSKRNKRDNTQSVPRKEKLKHVKEANRSLNAIMNQDLQVLTEMEREQLMEALGRARDLFAPYVKELMLIEQEERRLQQEREDTCKREGHVGKWEEVTYSKDAWIDHQLIKNMPYKKWMRRCTRCGIIEESQCKPKEIVDQEKREEIKELRKRIQEMESELGE